jgi:hypothetical protein
VENYGTAGQVTEDNIILRMRSACWIPKATDTYSEYVIHIAFPPQQWLYEGASILRHTNMTSVVGKCDLVMTRLGSTVNFSLCFITDF